MQKIYISFLFVLASFTIAHSQSLPPNTCGIVYSYDDAGNRTQRKYVCNNTVGARRQIDTETEVVQQVAALYPNPTTGIFKVTFIVPLKNAEVTLMDMEGRILQQRTVSGSQIDFDVSNFSSGMYSVRISEGDNLFTYKVLKQ